MHKLADDNVWSKYLSRGPAIGTIWHVRPSRSSKTQISLRIRAVWSESSMCVLWEAKGQTLLQAKTKTLIRLCGYWFGYSLYAHAILYLMPGYRLHSDLDKIAPSSVWLCSKIITVRFFDLGSCNLWTPFKTRAHKSARNLLNQDGGKRPL